MDKNLLVRLPGRVLLQESVVIGTAIALVSIRLAFVSFRESEKDQYTQNHLSITIVYQAKETVQQIKAAVKRRRVLLIITPILFLLLTMGAIQLIEPKYSSSTSMLVQKEETLNPLVLYEMAVNIASEDRLKSFNEILYSRSTVEMLIDSLNLADSLKTNAERQALVTRTQKNISTSSRASDSFEISFQNTDPIKARDGVLLLANHFIQTRLQLENRRNNETVDFFSKKLDELEQIVEQQRDQMVHATVGRMRETPIDNTLLQSRLQEVENTLDQVEWQRYQEEQQLAIVQEFLNQDVPAEHVHLLYRLPFPEIPQGEELSTLLREYDELRQQYTIDFPRTRTKIEQILQTVGRIPSSLESNLARLELQSRELSAQRARLINDMERSFVATQRASTQQSDFNIYESLYNEMKIKLEQARMTRDIGSQAAEQFIVLDHPQIAEEPVSPNKRLLLVLGVLLGCVVGVVASGVAEVMDTTVRTEEFMPFDKPIIAYLTHG